MSTSPEITIACPMPLRDDSRILLAHGGGGSLMHDLIQRVFLNAFRNDILAQQHDAAVVTIHGSRLALTTDSYVVHPLFFPGGDIGSLAVHGTVNDLAMAGARPLYLTASFIIEEGLPTETLTRVVTSMAKAANAAGVSIVTGDTKVVDRGKADGLFINTAGVGTIQDNVDIRPQRVKPGDVVIISGDLGRHGIAVMACREGLQFDTVIESDSTPVAEPVLALLDAGLDVHCLRDVTRGGLASVLNEIAQSAGVAIEIDESIVPVRDDVRGACELLGLDPCYVACEGRFVTFLPACQSERALEILQGISITNESRVIGSVGESARPIVTLRGRIGATRILDMLSGEQLPRIC